ncbi:MAG: hypothetical protein AAB466_07870 [Verrucomicrobiota bacterium]
MVLAMHMNLETSALINTPLKPGVNGKKLVRPESLVRDADWLEPPIDLFIP